MKNCLMAVWENQNIEVQEEALQVGYMEPNCLCKVDPCKNIFMKKMCMYIHVIIFI